jgi:hypothetical protein
MLLSSNIQIYCNGNYGILGRIVRIKNVPDKLYILSCAHVLNTPNADENVLLPQFDHQVIATMDASNSWYFDKDLDAALSEITNIELLIREGLYSNRTQVHPGWAQPRNGLVVGRWGNTNSKGKIAAIRDFTHGNRHRILIAKNEVTTTPLGAKGDSGSMWMNRNGKAVGMHLQGFPNYTAIATRMSAIIKRFNINIA